MTNLFFVEFYAGIIPESLGNLENLQRLLLYGNQLSGQFFYFSGWSVPTDHLNFTIFLPLFAAGAIPESLGNLVNLRELNLCNNKLEGHFFSFFGVVSAD